MGIHFTPVTPTGCGFVMMRLKAVHVEAAEAADRKVGESTNLDFTEKCLGKRLVGKEGRARKIRNMVAQQVCMDYWIVASLRGIHWHLAMP
jgi:hypothetical protein